MRHHAFERAAVQWTAFLTCVIERLEPANPDVRCGPRLRSSSVRQFRAVRHRDSRRAREQLLCDIRGRARDGRGSDPELRARFRRAAHRNGSGPVAEDRVGELHNRFPTLRVLFDRCNPGAHKGDESRARPESGSRLRSGARIRRRPRRLRSDSRFRRRRCRRRSGSRLRRRRRRIGIAVIAVLVVPRRRRLGSRLGGRRSGLRRRRSGLRRRRLTRRCYHDRRIARRLLLGGIHGRASE